MFITALKCGRGDNASAASEFSFTSDRFSIQTHDNDILDTIYLNSWYDDFYRFIFFVTLKLPKKTK